MDEKAYREWKRRQEIRRFRDRRELKELLKKAPKSPSVRTVSGGLPSLGKKR